MTKLYVRYMSSYPQQSVTLTTCEGMAYLR
jgi:hypothetical protein